MTTESLIRARRRFFRRLSPDRQEEVYENIEGLSSPVPSFYLMVAISSIIASYGLLANSTAVVIGAMLVAPLMGPIFGIALGTAAGDRRLLEMSFLAEALGVVIAVGISLLVGLMPLRVDFGSEIIGRTQPTIYDIIIALASGIAGTYALLNPRISPALPGVAIATSVVPPLATCGLCLSASRWNWALGAFLLFVANLLAIELAAAGVLSAYGVTDARPTKVHTIAGFLRRFGFSMVLLLAAAAFMTHTLATTIGNRRFAGALEQALSEQLRTSVGARLSDLSYTRRKDETEVIAVVLTPLEFTSEQIAGMERSLQERLHCRLHLVMRSLLSKDADRKGLVFLPEEQGEPTSKVDEQTEFLRTASASLTEGLSRIPGARLVDMRRDTDGDQSVVTAVVRSPTAVAPHQVVDLERALQHSLDATVTLVVRSILTRDADARSYLYERETEVVDTSVPSRARVEAALKNQLRGLEPAAQLEEFRFTRRGGELLLFAAVRTPRMLKPEEVALMQQAFRRYVEPTTRLVVRSSLGADASAEYLLSGFDESKLMETR